MLTISNKDPYKKLFAAHVMVTSRCNLNCYYCYYPPRHSDDPTLNQIAYVIDQYENIGESGIFYEVSGGEPMLRQDWFALVSLFLETGRDIVVSTNGTSIKEQEAELWTQLYQKYGSRLFLSISLDSIDPEVHNRIRGDYATAIEGMKNLTSRGVPYRVSITLTRHNLRTLIETVKFITDNLTNEVMVGILRPVFPLTEDNKKSILTLEEVQKAYHEVDLLRKKKPFEFYHCLSQEGQPGCLAGHDRAAVDVSGDVYPCYALQHIVLGNVYRDGLLPMLQAFRVRVQDKPVRDLLCERLTLIRSNKSEI